MEQQQLSQHTQAAMALTDEVTTKWDDRLAGSAACLACGSFLKEQLAVFCDRTESQAFSVRPGAFLGYIRINIVLYFITLFALFFQQIVVAVVIASLSLLITVLEFFFYKEFIDFLYPKKKGLNVFGTIEPEQEVKQQIIVSAHHDSAHIFNFLEKDPTTYPRKVISGTLTQFSMLIFTWVLFSIQVLGVQANILHWVLTGILTIAGLSLIPLWFFYSKKGTPGAGDNLICTALAFEIGRYFAQQKKAGKPLKHTRLVLASWDAEECGLRGARAFTKTFKSELQELKTYNFNLECMYDHKALHFLVSDLNNFVPLSTEMAEECVAIAKQLGYDSKTAAFPFLAGGTDAAEFAKAGVEATTLVGMDWTTMTQSRAYHTTRDTISAVDEEAVARAIQIGVQYILQKEKTI